MSVKFWREISGSTEWKQAQKRHTRTYCAGRFYYGSMSHVQHMQWRECAA